jgi:hypothetical protein
MPTQGDYDRFLEGPYIQPDLTEMAGTTGVDRGECVRPNHVRREGSGGAGRRIGL